MKKKVGFFRSIQLKFIIIYILLLLIAIQVIGSYFVRQLETELLDSFKDSITDRVELLSYNIEQAMTKQRPEDKEETSLENEIHEIVQDVGSDTNTRLQVIDAGGRVIATNTYVDQDIIGKKTTEEIIQKALTFGSSDEMRMRRSGSEERLYVRVDPLTDDEDDETIGAIYIESSLESMYDQLDNINKIFLRSSIIAIIVSAFIGILVARTITKPITEMQKQARIIATGDFTQKVNVYGKDEIGQLAETFNDMNDKLKHSYQTIQEEERKLSSVLYHMSDGVIATDRKGLITLMNDPAGHLLGYDPEKAIGRFVLDILQVEKRSVDTSELEESSSTIIDFSTEHKISLIRAKFSTVKDDLGEVNGFITVLSDVTEQEKVEQERREFVSNVSHELRTPLTTLQSYLEALVDGAWEDPGIAPKFLQVTQTETGRMIRMVNDLLQLSRMDNKEYALKESRTEFSQFMNGIIDRFEMNLESHLTFKRNLTEDLYVWIDQDKMTQVLDNVISNAIKYSPEGGEIIFTCKKRRNELLVSVEDQGLGIAYDKLDKIFDRFYRTDLARTRKLGGTGLGLAITKEIVEAHYGQIWAESKEGKGTTILFTLPLMNGKRRENR